MTKMQVVKMWRKVRYCDLVGDVRYWIGLALFRTFGLKAQALFLRNFR